LAPPQAREARKSERGDGLTIWKEAACVLSLVYS
jgi:hypothetical protein